MTSHTYRKMALGFIKEWVFAGLTSQDMTSVSSSMATSVLVTLKSAPLFKAKGQSWGEPDFKLERTHRGAFAWYIMSISKLTVPKHRPVNAAFGRNEHLGTFVRTSIIYVKKGLIHEHVDHICDATGMHIS